MATLFLGSFVLGSADLLMVGLLNLVAAGLRVSVPARTMLVGSIGAAVSLLVLYLGARSRSSSRSAR